jgi:hypothetical protein
LGISLHGYLESILTIRFVRSLVRNLYEAHIQPDDPYYKERTALEFLQDEQVKTLERIRLNRYGEKQRLADEKLLRHRDAIIDILER